MPEQSAKISTIELASMWTIAGLALLAWCAFVGWAWVSFYEYSGAARGFLVGLGFVSALLLVFYIAICAIAMDEWSESTTRR